MRRLRPHFTRPPPPSKVERAWLGAEALPGGALPLADEPAQARTLDPVPPASSGLAAWFAAALRWTRRGRAT